MNDEEKRIQAELEKAQQELVMALGGLALAGVSIAFCVFWACFALFF